MSISEITFKEVSKQNKPAIEKFISEYWGSNLVVVHNTKYYPSELNGFAAFIKNEIAGLITYIIENNELEIITLNSKYENLGIGTKLMELIKNTAKVNCCRNIWLITTNDNLLAIKFYQKSGFQLVRVYPDAVEEARKIKPEIPLIGESGIPIRDELKFNLRVGTD